MTLKIVDNTFISACLGEIECLNLLDISTNHYNVSTTPEVYVETIEGFEKDFVSKAYAKINIDPVDHEKYDDLKEWLEKRYPQIHSGEISTFLLALLNHALDENEYYYITDDRKMKETIDKLNSDKEFMNKLGSDFDMSTFNVAGTIGFIRRLIEKKTISEDFIEPIIEDMDNNGFYIDEKIKNYLRGG